MLLQENDAQCMCGLLLYSLDRLYRAVERHAKATGEWQWLVSVKFYSYISIDYFVHCLTHKHTPLHRKRERNLYTSGRKKERKNVNLYRWPIVTVLNSLKEDILELAKPGLETGYKLTVTSRMGRMYECLLPSLKRQ